MVTSLLLTGLGGFVLFLKQDLLTLKILYGVWGATTSLLFFSALIIFIRNFSSEKNQGKTFGLLEFGRGLFTACLVTIVTLSLNSSYLGFFKKIFLSKEDISPHFILLFYTLVTLFASLVCFLFLRESKEKKIEKKQGKTSPETVIKILKNPLLWCNLFIIICAYSAFKGIDYYSLFMKESFSLSHASLSYFILLLAWSRPFSALAFGFLGDKIKPSKACLLCFSIIFITSFLVFILPTQTLRVWPFLILIFFQTIGIFGLRAIYFALFHEAHVKRQDTGTATGFISFLGFTPEFFLPLVSISLIDANPGPGGFQNFFLFIACLSVFGFFASKKIESSPS